MSAATPFCFRGVSSTLQDTIAQITPKSNGVEFAFSEVKGGQGGEAHNMGRFVSVLTRKHREREREREESGEAVTRNARKETVPLRIPAELNLNMQFTLSVLRSVCCAQAAGEGGGEI